MKLSLLGIVILLAAACGNNKLEKNETSEKEAPVIKESKPIICTAIPEDYIAYDASDMNFDLDIMAPVDAEIYTSLYISDDYEQDQLVIQMNASSDIKLFVRKAKVDIDELKKEAKEDMFNTFQEFIIDTENEFVYETINSEDVIIYHLARVYTKNNVDYFIHTDIFSDYDFETIEQLYPIAHQIK
jgi:hypothetical protein